MSPEEYERCVAFYEATKNAAMITVDATTGRPLFAQWMDHRTWDGRIRGRVVQWFDPPDGHALEQERRVAARMLFEYQRAMIDHIDLPGPTTTTGEGA